MKRRLRIGIAEIGIFGTSVAMLGLVFWFLSLTLFGSSNNSEARLLVSMGPAAGSAVIAPAARQFQTPPAVPETMAPVSAEPVKEAPVQEAAEPPDVAPAQEEKIEEAAPIPQDLTAQVPEQKNEGEAPPAPINAAIEGSVPPPPGAIVPPSPMVPEPPSKEAAADVPKAEADAAAPAASGLIEYKPAAQRDPMMKPDEVQAMERLRRQKEEAVKERSRPKKPQVTTLTTVKNRIKVQGVINTPEGIVAIVNDEIYRKGDTVAGVKILRILGNRVQFKYGQYIFEKNIDAQ